MPCAKNWCRGRELVKAGKNITEIKPLDEKVKSVQLTGENGLVPSSRSSKYMKPFWTSAVAGTCFGLVASLVFQRFVVPPWPPALFTAGISLVAGLISGVAALGSAFL